MSSLGVLAIMVFISAITARKAPALDDICARATYAFCPQQRGSAPRQLAAADEPPPPSSSSTGNKPQSVSDPALSEGDYCSRYQPHYMYYCDLSEAHEQKAAKFCQDYVDACILKKQSDTASVQQQEPTPKQQKPAKRPLMVPCSTYQAQFVASCSDRVSNTQTAQFCQTFQTYCLTNGATVPPKAPPQTAPVDSLSLDQIKDKCLEYKTAGKLYCTGPATKRESLSSQVKSYCELFRRYCIDTGFVQAKR